MEGKNVWRLCKTYGRLIGYPMLKPHDLRHGVAMEVYEQVRGLLGHARIEGRNSTLRFARPRSSRRWSSTRAKALDVLSSFRGDDGDMSFVFESGRRRDSNMQPSNINETKLVAPTGHVRTYIIQARDLIGR
jgi:hypothetical protein